MYFAGYSSTTTFQYDNIIFMYLGRSPATTTPHFWGIECVCRGQQLNNGLIPLTISLWCRRVPRACHEAKIPPKEEPESHCPPKCSNLQTSEEEAPGPLRGSVRYLRSPVRSVERRSVRARGERGAWTHRPEEGAEKRETWWRRLEPGRREGARGEVRGARGYLERQMFL